MEEEEEEEEHLLPRALTATLTPRPVAHFPWYININYTLVIALLCAYYSIKTKEPFVPVGHEVEIARSLVLPSSSTNSRQGVAHFRAEAIGKGR